MKAKHFFQLQKKELDKNIASQVGTYMSKLDRIKELQSKINILSESLNDLQNKEKEIDKTIKTNCYEEVFN